VILSKLPGGVALRFERGGNRAGLGRHADIRARLADGRQTRADRQLPVMKFARPAVQLASA
jgi:hypothetical protein